MANQLLRVGEDCLLRWCLLLKAALPTCVPSRRGLSLLQHAPRSSPTAWGLGPTRHASRLRAEEAKPPCTVRTTAQRLQATLHFCPDQRAKGAGSHAGGMQPRQVGALLQLPTRPTWIEKENLDRFPFGCFRRGIAEASCYYSSECLHLNTESNTMYPGSRKNALEHLECAWQNGFTPLTVGCPTFNWGATSSYFKDK